MSMKRETRQRTREMSGKYEPYPKCNGCKKPCDPNGYASHSMTDCHGDDGVNWADTAIVLCDRCHARTDHMRNVSEFERYRDTGWY